MTKTEDIVNDYRVFLHDSNTIGIVIRKKEEKKGIRNKEILLKSTKTLVTKMGRKRDKNFVSHIALEKDKRDERGYYPYHIHLVIEDVMQEDRLDILYLLKDSIKGNNEWIEEDTKSNDISYVCSGKYGKVSIHPIYDITTFTQGYMRKGGDENYTIFMSFSSKYND